MTTTSLKDKLDHVPLEPGVYMMKNAKGEIVYVGKAKLLRNRLRSYFTAIDGKDLKTKVLIRAITDFEIILTKNEVEALLLERTLIRHHHPRYNVLLKDGKEYPYVRVDFKEPWPRMEKVRRRKDDGAFYLGPFSNAGSLTTSIKLVGRVFPLIRCSRHEFKTVKRPCNYYHMKMCLGPCKLPVDRDAYVGTIRSALAMLAGNNRDLAKDLKARMAAASNDQAYELAAQLRDQLRALDEIGQRQTAVIKTVDDADVLGIYMREETTAFHVLMVREGRVIGGENFLAKSPIQTEEEALAEFLLQYYDQRLLPSELILPIELKDADELVKALGPQDLRDMVKRTCNVNVPKKGPRHDLVVNAIKNATYHFDEWQRERSRNKVEIDLLQEFLKTDRLLHRIECFDISNLQGQEVVASNVCFIDGKPAKEFYRHYNVKELAPGQQDDFASIREVIGRRLRRGYEENDLPDLIVIDGGKGQLNAALAALEEFPQTDTLFISLAKARIEKDRPGNDPKYSYERVFFPNQELSIPLKPGSPVCRLLTHLRDEAHRFAITHHRNKRAKTFTSSELDEISGIGPTLRKRLLEHFQGLEGIKNASIEQLLAVKGVKETLAVAIHSKFH